MVAAADVEPEVYTVDEVSKILRVHPVTVRRWLSTGQVASFTVGTARRIPKSEVDKLVHPHAGRSHPRVEDN